MFTIENIFIIGLWRIYIMANNQPKQDLYILGQSNSQSITSPTQEIRLDLSLQTNPNLNSSTIYGKVEDSEGKPIPNALIKIMSNTYEPLSHTFTAADGTYSFTNFKPGSNYQIFAIAQGYALNQNIPFTLNSNDNVEKNFTLAIDANASNSIIAGDAYDSSSTLPIDGAVVKLFSIGEEDKEKLEAITFTNQFGQFLFRELPQGNYLIRLTCLGYMSITNTVNITQSGQITNVILNVVRDTATARGTVSGIITDSNNQPISNADVVLYSSSTDTFGKETLTPIAFTKTNSSGIYLFINVPQGTYKIKSDKTYTITVPATS